MRDFIVGCLGCSGVAVLLVGASLSVLGGCNTTDAEEPGADASSDATVDKDASPDASVPPDAPADATTDALAETAADGPIANGFSLLVTESPAGPDNQSMATWKGVQRFRLAGSGEELVPATGIDGQAVADPAGLVFNATLSELFVGNRHGNNSADGTAGSVSRFTYDKSTETLTANGTITGNGLSGVHQLNFDPVTGELFAANFGGGVSRFTFGAGGDAVANGVVADGSTRGVVVAPDGSRLYVTMATSVVRQFELPGGSELASVTVSAGSAGLHYMAILNNVLYVTALYEEKVYRYSIDGGELTLKDSFDAHSPVSVAFSPDGTEMYAAGHRTTDVINRFDYDAQSDTWVSTSLVSTTSSLGDLAVID